MQEANEICPLWVPLTNVKIMERTCKRVVFRKPDNGGWNDHVDVEICKDCAKDLAKWLETPPVVEVNIDGHVI